MSPPTDRSRPLVVRYRLDAPACDGVDDAAIFDAAAPLPAQPATPLTAREVCRILPSGAESGGPPEPIDVGALPLPIGFCRALDGWVFLATPDHKAWRGLCMTFLNRDVARRFDRDTAWRSREVLELTGLVLGTYACEDLDGRCATFNIPCVTAVDGHPPTAFPIRYAAIMLDDAPSAAAH